MRYGGIKRLLPSLLHDRIRLVPANRESVVNFAPHLVCHVRAILEHRLGALHRGIVECEVVLRENKKAWLAAFQSKGPG